MRAVHMFRVCHTKFKRMIKEFVRREASDQRKEEDFQDIRFSWNRILVFCPRFRWEEKCNGFIECLQEHQSIDFEDENVSGNFDRDVGAVVHAWVDNANEILLYSVSCLVNLFCIRQCLHWGVLSVAGRSAQKKSPCDTMPQFAHTSSSSALVVWMRARNFSAPVRYFYLFSFLSLSRPT